MTPRELFEHHLQQQHMMQLATVSRGQPWCCTVYYVADAEHNLYWASLPSRRHSQELENNPRVAAAIPIVFERGQKVIGIQLEGTAEQLPPTPAIRPIAEQYADKFGRTPEWVDDFTAGRTEHRLYRLTPSSVVLFDDQHFPADPRQVVT